MSLVRSERSKRVKVDGRAKVDGSRESGRSFELRLTLQYDSGRSFASSGRSWVIVDSQKESKVTVQKG